MPREQDYRKHAAYLLNLASRSSMTADKSHLLAMAEAWLDLAERSQKHLRTGRPRDGHPAIRAKLGDGVDA